MCEYGEGHKKYSTYIYENKKLKGIIFNSQRINKTLKFLK